MANGLRSRLVEYADTVAAKHAEVETLGHRLAQEQAQVAESKRRAEASGEEVRRLQAEIAEYEAARLNAKAKATQIEKGYLNPLAKAC